ncbi:uncharacterized protein LOC131150749 isoform X2 [Malania oleifera]|uniref:uncharacterized protein LOC131150749 isoform X2 n=1 Tax=Malania oleifera TaxID=397392 RepID=UPI0025AE18E3|nr:uncharacterized protein LOC131150749 isoform X2 [Malania oleifera]
MVFISLMTGDSNALRLGCPFSSLLCHPQAAGGRRILGRNLSAVILPSPLRFSATAQRPSRILRYPSVQMASYPNDVRSTAAIGQPELHQLNDESDFERLLSPDGGYFSVCGFGSLLSEASARSTFPYLINFRIARLNGFRRVFAHAAAVFFERGIAKPETKEISSLSVEPCEGETLVVTVFEIQRSEIPSFIEREHEFRFVAVLPETLDGKPFSNPAVLCARSSDEEYFKIRCKGSKEIYFQRFGRYNIHKIWQDDILPCRVYLRHCKESE